MDWGYPKAPRPRRPSSSICPPRHKRWSAPTITFLLAALLGTSAAANAEWVEWITDAEVKYSFNSNINNSAFENEEEGENLLIPILSLGRFYQVDETTRLLGIAEFSYHYHDQFDRLNRTAVIGHLIARRKLGLGPDKVWLRGGVSAGNLFSTSPLRDAYVFGVDFRVGKPLNQQLNFQVGYAFDFRNSSAADPIVEWDGQPTDLSGDAFDRDGHQLGVGIDLLLSEQALVTLNYALRFGDMTSTCSGPSFTEVFNAGAVTAAVFDDVFGGCAYRSDMTLNSGSIDLSYAFLHGHASFNLGYEFRSGTFDDFSYKGYLIHTNLNYSR